MATHSSTLAWKIPWTEEPGGLQSMGRWGSDMTEQLHFHFPLSYTGEGNGNLLGAGVRHSAHDKGHEEGGSAHAKAGIEPQESPWKSSSIYPHNHSLPTLLLYALTYTSDFMGGCLPPPLSEKELT